MSIPHTYTDTHKDGTTPLHYAAFTGSNQLTTLLLSHGAKHTPDLDGRYPLHWATHNTDFDVFCLFAYKVRVHGYMLVLYYEVDISLLRSIQFHMILHRLGEVASFCTLLFL